MNHRPREIDSYRPSPSQNRGRDYLRPEDGHHEYRRSPGASLRRDDSRESSGHNPRKRPHSPQSMKEVIWNRAPNERSKIQTDICQIRDPKLDLYP
ncbi:Protein of unknown function [Pyronema omphalodes CBS 100304]|nr:Protein of unknown function [Pyronema omphalodes CBS 100304]